MIASGIYLLLISGLWEWLHNSLKLNEGIPESLVEQSNLSWFILNFIMEFLFYSAIPSIGYSFFYLILPFEGFKAGLAAALFALILGGVPIIMIISVRLKLPLAYLTFTLLGYFVKLAGSIIIIGYLYSL
jgi:hypothetical protein